MLSMVIISIVISYQHFLVPTHTKYIYSFCEFIKCLFIVLINKIISMNTYKRMCYLVFINRSNLSRNNVIRE